MSRSGQPALSPLDGSELSVGVVAAQWHPEVTDGLLAGAARALADAGVDKVAVLRVPGSFELPVVAQALAQRGHDAVVALGVVVRGGTPHFDYVCTAVTDGLSRVALDSGVPVGFGVLTCDDDDQARDRAGLEGSTEDKGYESTHAALSAALALRALMSSGVGGPASPSVDGDEDV
jgi:6,7-dimethyl-8-ribityllumazine synthase